MLFIEEYKYSDKSEVMNLFHAVSGKLWTDDFWNWRFGVNEFGPPIRYVMRDNDKIVGNYVVHPIPLKIRDHIYSSIFSMNTFTHPDYRGKGIMQQLAQRTFEMAKDLGYDLVFGFPNQNSQWIFFNRLEWKNFGNIRVFRKQLSRAVRAVDSVYKIEPIAKFGSETDDLWEDHNGLYEVIIPRTTRYLKWRFLDSPKIKWVGSLPSTYHPFAVRIDNNLVGYFVIKIFEGVKGHIVDCFGDLSRNMIDAIIRYAINFCIAQGLNELTLWSNQMLENVGLSDLCHDFEFSEECTQEFWGVNVWRNGTDTTILDKTKWFVTMSDSDIY